MAEKQVSLKLLVDKEKNKVLSAEAGKDFVDAVFSFLTLPLGTIARIVKKDSNLKPMRFGSLSSLYQSVADLEDKYFCAETCKEMLLWPRSSMESNQNPKLNIDDTPPIKYFVCNDGFCKYWQEGSLASTIKNKRCGCGRLMDREIQVIIGSLKERRKNHEGYVKEGANFTLYDNLKVEPSGLLCNAVLLKNFAIKDMDLVQEMTVQINQTEVLDLLKCSLFSNMPLTDVLLRKKEVEEDFDLDGVFPYDFEIGKMVAQAEESKPMMVKVVLQKSKRKVLFVEAEEDFTDFLVSFLTLPLGAILDLLQGNSGLINLENLKKSLLDLDANKHLRSEEIKNILIKPQIASQFKLQNLILPIMEATASNYYYNGEVPLTIMHPISSNCVRFTNRPGKYMVTDDLVVTPISSISIASFLTKSKIPFHDLEERVIGVGLEEGLSILKASLISSSALTVGLTPFIRRQMGGVGAKIDLLISRFQYTFKLKFDQGLLNVKLVYRLITIFLLIIVLCFSRRFRGEKKVDL